MDMNVPNCGLFPALLQQIRTLEVEDVNRLTLTVRFPFLMLVGNASPTLKRFCCPLEDNKTLS